MAPGSRSSHSKFRQALINGNIRQVQQVVDGYAHAKQLSTQDAIAELMSHIYEDDCCGSGLLYLAAGCKMNSKALQCTQMTAGASSAAAPAAPAQSNSSKQGSRGNRPSVFTCISGTSSCSKVQDVKDSSGSESSADAVDDNKRSRSQTHQSFFSRWYYGSSSSSKQYTDPAAARAEILNWILTVTSEANDRSWLNLNLVNSRCQSVLHLCLLNGSSTEVLKLLLQHGSSSSSSSNGSSSGSSSDGGLSAVWGLEDAAGFTPLHLAITLQDWQAVSLMLAAGAAAAASSSSSSSDMAAAQQTVAGLLAGRRRKRSAVAAAAGSSRGGGSSAAAAGSSIVGMVGQLVSRVLLPSSSSSSSSSSSNARRAIDQQMQRTNVPCTANAADHAATVKASDVSAVAEEVKQAVQQVAEVANIPPATAMTLLAANAYDVDQAIDAAYNVSSSSSSSSTAAGSSGAVVEVDTPELTAASSSSSSSSCCVVCFEEAAPTDLPNPSTTAAAAAAAGAGSSTSSVDKVTVSVQLPCGHVTCDSCWRGVITACIDDLGVHRAVCPVSGCGALLPLDAVEQLVDEQLYQRYLSLLAQHVIDSSPQCRWCPAPNCGRSLRMTNHTRQQQQQQRRGGSSSSRGFDVVCECGCRFCWLCQEPAHEPATCQQVVSWRQLLTAAAAAAEDQSTDWVAANTRCCPKCNSRIQRDGGCNHMTCRICGHQFCWVCGNVWSMHSQDTGGYYDCYLRQTAAAAGDNAAAAAGSRSVQQQQQQQGSVISQVLGSVMTAMQNAVLNHKQKIFLSLHLQHEVNAERLRLLLRYQQLLLAAVTSQQQQQQTCDTIKPVGLRSLCEIIADEQQQQQQQLLLASQQQQQQQLLQQLTDLPPLPPSAPIRVLQRQQQQEQEQQGMMQQQQQEKQRQAMQRQAMQQQQYYYPPLTDALFDTWLSCILQCKETLRWSCVVGYYAESAAARSYLEHLQGRLSQTTDQLVALIQQLPAAQQVVDAAAAAAKRKAAAAGGVTSAAVRTMRTMWGRFWQQMGYSSSSSSNVATGRTSDSSTMHSGHAAAAATAADLWFDVTANALQQQVHYVLAVSSRLADIQLLMRQAHSAQDVLLCAARQGAFDGTAAVGVHSAAAVGNASLPAAAIGGSSAGRRGEASQLTMLDVIAAGSDTAFLGEVLATGAAELWRSITRPSRP